MFVSEGFVVVRQSGSHVVLKRAGHRNLVAVPKHGKKDLKPGMLRALIRGAGMTVEQFVEKL